MTEEEPHFGEVWMHGNSSSGPKFVIAVRADAHDRLMDVFDLDHPEEGIYSLYLESMIIPDLRSKWHRIDEGETI